MFKKIIWAVDGSESADRGLPYVRALAEQEGAALVLVHVAETFVGPRAAGVPVHIDEDEIKAKVKRVGAELADEGLEVTTKIVPKVGTMPAHEIADAAREVGADLIVVGTRGQTPLAGLLLGSVTQRLLHIAPCPVLAVPVAYQATSEGEVETAHAETVA